VPRDKLDRRSITPASAATLQQCHFGINAAALVYCRHSASLDLGEANQPSIHTPLGVGEKRSTPQGEASDPAGRAQRGQRRRGRHIFDPDKSPRPTVTSPDFCRLTVLTSGTSAARQRSSVFRHPAGVHEGAPQDHLNLRVDAAEVIRGPAAECIVHRRIHSEKDRLAFPSHE
jgi:hypothetical protein